MRPTEEERAALTPALRRQAMLKALDPLSTELHALILVPIGALLLGTPYLVTLASGSTLSVGHLALIYLLYIPCLVAALVVVLLGFFGLIALVEDRSQPLTYATMLTAASAVTVGMTPFWLYLDDADATFLLSLFSALLAVFIAVLIVSAGTPIAEARKRRELGMMGVDHTAALLLLEEWEALIAQRQGWRTPAGRRELSHALNRLAASASSQLDRSVRANGGGAADRRWAQDPPPPNTLTNCAST